MPDQLGMPGIYAVKSSDSTFTVVIAPFSAKLKTEATNRPFVDAGLPDKLVHAVV